MRIYCLSLKAHLVLRSNQCWNVFPKRKYENIFKSFFYCIMHILCPALNRWRRLYIYIYIYIRIRIRTRTYAHTHTHTHIYTHVTEYLSVTEIAQSCGGSSTIFLLIFHASNADWLSINVIIKSYDYST